MPSARTTIFGSALKARLGVNGLQSSSSETWRGWGWSRSVSAAWYIGVSLLLAAGAAALNRKPQFTSNPNEPLQPEPVALAQLGQEDLPAEVPMRHHALTVSPVVHSSAPSIHALSQPALESADPAHLQEQDQPAGADPRDAGRGDPRRADAGRRRPPVAPPPPPPPPR